MAYHVPIHMPDGSAPPAIMTADECARLLRLDSGARGVDRLVQKRALRPVLLGGRRRYPLIEVVRFIDDELQAATPPDLR